MNAKQLGLGVVLVGFLALTAYAFAQHGVMGLFSALLANPATILVSTDLTIALVLVWVWLWQDARARGISPLPYVLITLAFGSAGPLLYLIRRAGSEQAQPVRVAA
ncbi:MAG: DUF2834 domain-containing protein [Candidatus Binatia bacterium]